MTWIDLGFLFVAFLIVVLFFLSLIESSIARLSQVSLKVLAEKQEHQRIQLLENISKDRIHFLLPLQFGIQALQSVIAVLVCSLFLMSSLPYAVGWALFIALLVVVLFRQLIPKMLIQDDPGRMLLRLLPFFGRYYHLLEWLSLPLRAVLKTAHGALGRKQISSREKEPNEKEIEAYIDVGEEEGIIEEEESELIQSALEFGNTLVKEIMTPRADMVAIKEHADLSQLQELMISSKHSRIPVYRDHLDQIIGVAYLRNVLARLAEGKAEGPITRLAAKPMLIPETQGVSKLLKEMQESAEHMAIVVNEYGVVSGLVTIEDVIEEIVGEIRDEDELQKTDSIIEVGGSYIVRGRTGIEDLEQALELDLGDRRVSTVSGLIVGYLGRVPKPGERVKLNGIQIEIVSSDRRRIHSVRLTKLDESPHKA